MRKLLVSLALILAATTVFYSCAESNKENKEHPRIAIAGLAIESSTFSPAVTHAEAFRTRRGEDVFSYYPFFSQDSALIDEAEWLPTLRGHAMPGGIVTREAYETLVQETLERQIGRASCRERV